MKENNALKGYEAKVKNLTPEQKEQLAVIGYIWVERCAITVMKILKEKTEEP